MCSILDDNGVKYDLSVIPNGTGYWVALSSRMNGLLSIAIQLEK